MATCSISFKNEALGQCTHMEALVPDRRKGPLPVLYLLHGLSDNDTVWTRNVPLADLVRDLPLIVVMPDCGKGFYCNDPRPAGAAWEDHVIGDVIGFADRVLPTIASRTGRAVAGNSMGGYGALMLALRHGDVFCAAVSHSGALYFAHGDRPGGKSYGTELMSIMPPGDYDVFALAERAKAAGTSLPALRLDCGSEDGLVAGNRQFHAHLDLLGIPHEYAEHPGGHNWQFWRDHVGETLNFVMRHLAAK